MQILRKRPQLNGRDIIIIRPPLSGFSPLNLLPLQLLDTDYVLGADKTIPPLNLRRETEGDEIPIMGWNPEDPRQYKTSIDGAYETNEALLFPAERFFPVDWFDQSQGGGPEMLVDGDMEAAGTSGWLSINTTLSKETTDPAEGLQCLRVANAGLVGFAAQNVLTIGKIYHVTGWARGDGSTGQPRVGQAPYIWNGTTSNTWQKVDFVCNAVSIAVRLTNTNTAGYAEFDQMTWREIQGYHATQTTGANQPELVWDGLTLGSEEEIVEFDFTNWVNYNSTDTADTFTTTAASGGVYKHVFTVGRIYKLIISGTVNEATGGFFISNGFGTRVDLYYKSTSGAFVAEVVFAATQTELYVRKVSGGVGDSVTISAMSAKEVSSWDYPVLDSDGVDDYMDLDLTHAASDYTFFTRIEQPLPGGGPNVYLFDDETGRLLIRYPSSTSNNIGYHYLGTSVQTPLTKATFFNASIVLASPAYSVIYNNAAAIASSLTYTQAAIGARVTLGSHYTGTNVFNGKMKSFIIYAKALSPGRVGQLDKYYS